MIRLYKILMASKYILKHFYSYKAFTFEENNGEWQLQFTISKYGREYIIEGFEGTKSFIKTFNIKFDKYQDVVKYLKLKEV